MFYTLLISSCKLLAGIFKVLILTVSTLAVGAAEAGVFHVVQQQGLIHSCSKIGIPVSAGSEDVIRLFSLIILEL